VFSRAVDVAYSNDGEMTAEDAEASGFAHDVYEERTGGRLKEIGLENDRRGGFQAALYGGADGGPYYLAMAGTNPLSLADWGADVMQALGFKSGHYEKGIALAQAVSEKVGVGNLIIVGHSLGGGLASAAAIATGARAITFNAAGLNRYYRNGSAVDIRAHYTRGDILNMVQRYSPLPNSVGAQVPHTPAWSKDPISRHGVF
jgi:pimeloyl-ACP methyl ester carboxylesterase